MEAVLLSSHIEETSVLKVILQHAGFMVRESRSLNQAVENWPDNPADFIMVVLTEEHTKVISHIKKLRAHTVVPILLIADPIPEDIHVSYLEAGADMILVRPYGVRILFAQIRTLLRRGSGVPFFSLPILTRKDINLDPANRTVQVADREPVRLTHLEFRLMYTLMTHAGQILSTEQIVEYVWGYSGEGNRELVRGLVQRVRSKVEANPRTPEYILTDPGIGYYFQG